MADRSTPHSCPVCASARTRVLVPVRIPCGREVVLAAGIRGCRTCGHRFLPTTAAEQHVFDESYGTTYSGYQHDHVFVARAAETLDRSVIPRRPPPARLLDVGCGNGDFLAVATARGYQAEGIDTSAYAVDL